MFHPSSVFPTLCNTCKKGMSTFQIPGLGPPPQPQPQLSPQRSIPPSIANGASARPPTPSPLNNTAPSAVAGSSSHIALDDTDTTMTDATIPPSAASAPEIADTANMPAVSTASPNPLSASSPTLPTLPTGPPTRLELELEFVTLLASPVYLNHLASLKLFQSPEFLNYLRYLRYWSRKEYVVMLQYPGTSLRSLELLTAEGEYGEAFRRDMGSGEVVGRVMGAWGQAAMGGPG